MSKSNISIILISLLLLASNAFSAQINYQISGKINPPDYPYLPSSPELVSLSDHQNWFAYFTIDSDTVGESTSLPSGGESTIYQGLTGTLSVNGVFDLSIDLDASIKIEDNVTNSGSRYDVITFLTPASGVVVDGWELSSLYIQAFSSWDFNNDASDPLASTDLLESLNAGDLSVTVLTLNFEDLDGDDTTFIRAKGFGSIAVSEVPLPAGFWLFASALLPLLGIKAGRK